MIRQEEAVGVAGRAQAGRAPRRAGGRRGRVRLLGLAALVVIGATVSAAVGLPGRLFKTQPRPIVTIAVGAKPSGVAVDPAAHCVYVANSGSASVSVLDTESNAVVATVQVGRGPVAVAVDPATHRAYVANQDDGAVSVLGMNGML